MKFIGEFKCPKCGWVHIGISEADAVAQVHSVNAFFATLSEEQKQQFGGTNASLERYKRCFRCGNPSANFVPANRTDRPPAGATMQAVIAPSLDIGRNDGN